MLRPFFARLSASIARRRNSLAAAGSRQPATLRVNREERFSEAVSRLYSQGVGRGF